MTLQVIGPGFGRTGTSSLKTALEMLGLGPCHHMEEVLRNPQQVPLWEVVAAGGPVDWRELFKGYRAQVDWPGAHVWRELVEAFPDAKVVHSLRPEESWWRSFSQTIGPLMAHYHEMPLPPHVRAMMAAAHDMTARQTFGGRFSDREHALACYRLRTEEVRAVVPAERLLIYDVSEGWEPLCRFLGLAAPDTPFPHRNASEDFWKPLGGRPPVAAA